jgi:hypothetical protein
MTPKLILAVIGIVLEVLSFAIALPIMIPVGAILIGIAVIVP